MMSAEKRPAHESLGSVQLVKRQRSDSNLNRSAVTISSGTGKNEALIQSVSRKELIIFSPYLGSISNKDRRYPGQAASLLL